MLFQQNESVAGRRDLFVQMVDAADRVTPRTGLTLAVQIVKAGASAYAAIAGGWSEVGRGTYRISLAAGDLNTIGQAMLEVASAGAVTRHISIQVVRFLDEVHLAKAALANARRHTIDTGVDAILDDNGSTVLRTLTPSETGGVVTITPS